MQQFEVLSDISLTIGAQDFITIVGPNGAGKSTLLQCLLGLFSPSHGRIIRKPGLKIGYVPQQFQPNRMIPITARRFLLLGKNMHERDLGPITQELQLGPILGQSLLALSGGQLQRVMLARSLLGEPELLVLDEPARNLDIGSQLALYRIIEQIYTHRQISIVMVSHDLHMVMARTRKVICLFHHICCSGSAQQVANDPEFSALFGDDMAAMMAFYQHSHNHRHEEEPHV
ncbi:MAG: ATP-binding cassette domain-containing protein [Pseudomonadota bacterium]